MDDEGLSALSAEEQTAVLSVATALVQHDEPTLRRIGAFDKGADPYEPTRRWARWDHVDLVLPAGDPTTWELSSERNTETGWAAVDLRMWTAQEAGPSDLVLHLDVHGFEVIYRGMWT